MIFAKSDPLALGKATKKSLQLVCYENVDIEETLDERCARNPCSL